MRSLSYYSNFQKKALKIKLELLEFLVKQKRAGKKVAAYGAAAKGNTLLNYCGVKNDLIDYVVDDSPHKQNKFLPGSHIPIVDKAIFEKNKPDFVIILPWNIKEDIMAKLAHYQEMERKFVVPIPTLQIIKPKK